jgi:hypothetical protein
MGKTGFAFRRLDEGETEEESEPPITNEGVWKVSIAKCSSWKEILARFPIK